MAVGDVRAIAVRGSWWRQTPAGRDPFTRSSDPPDGRWQRGEVVDALYLADQPDTAWAEWYRALAELQAEPLGQMPRELWRLQVAIERAADICGERQLSDVGLQLPRPGRESWPAYQAVGEALHEAGWPALVAPSAARPGGRVLCIFRVADAVSAVTRHSPPQRFEQPPPPPRGLRT